MQGRLFPALTLTVSLVAGPGLAQDSGPARGLDGPYDRNNSFARILRGELPGSKVLESDDLVVLIPLSQASRGHVLVIPKCDCRTLSEVPTGKMTAVMTTLQTLMVAERIAYHPDGFNVRQNNGAEAGQTVFHVHFHLIPRYAGETLQLDESIHMTRDAMYAAANELRAALKEPT